MRNAFINALTEIAAQDDKIVFLTADLGYKLFDDFARRYPGRFMNVGVAEANMVGVSSGLALEGLRPFVYSIVPFATMRCFEQIRNDLAYHHADVKVVGVGGGYSYGHNGPTHHAIEDVAVLRALPNLVVLSPGDPRETEACVHALGKYRGPAYLRLGRAGEPVVHSGPVKFEIGKSLLLRDGGDAALLASGSLVATAAQVGELLAAQGKNCRVLSMPSIKPLDFAAIESAARDTGCVVTLEEHSIIGGLGSAVAEHLLETGIKTKFKRFGAKDAFSHICGDQAYHRAALGLTPDQLAASIGAML